MIVMVCLSAVVCFYSPHITECFTLPAVAVVGLEETDYNVSESDGAVELCAVVYIPDGFFDCPITLSFSVSLSTSGGSAGNSIMYPLTAQYTISL